MKPRTQLVPIALGETMLLVPTRAPLDAAPWPAALLARGLDVPFVPTSQSVVEAMLTLAGVEPADRVFDLGSGDGRIVIAAALRGAHAVGVDLDPNRIREARASARSAGVEDRVEFREGDLLDADLDGATVVMLYLLPSVNARLMPLLLSELRPGTRVVSHAFDMGDWKPTRTLEVDGTTLYLWVVPGWTAR